MLPCSHISLEWIRNHISGLIGIPKWPPLSISEVINLIHCLKSGKAPGGDNITADLLKANLTGGLQSCFIIHLDWFYSLHPEGLGIGHNYCNFSKGLDLNQPSIAQSVLLSVISKICGSHLQRQLLDWLDLENMLEGEQTCFRAGHLIVDQGLILQLLSRQIYIKRWCTLCSFHLFQIIFWSHFTCWTTD